MNYASMDYAVASVVAERFVKANDKEGLRNFLMAFEDEKLDFASKTKKLGAARSLLNKFFKAFFRKYPIDFTR